MLEKAFIIAFIVMFIWATMLKGMIFGFVRKYLETRISEYWQKPLFDCPTCMVVYHGSIAYWMFFAPMEILSLWPLKFKIPFSTFEEWIIVIFTAGGINQVFLKLFPHDNQKMTLTAEEIITEQKE